MRVLHLCYTDGRSGAGIGAFRLHQAMVRHGVDSWLVVAHKFTKDKRVVRMPRPQWRFRPITRLNSAIFHTQTSGNPVYKSLNIFPTGTAAFLNRLGGDVIQMHWVGNHTISIGEITRLKAPVFWKLPDMWAFSGTEHYMLPADPPRFEEGYRRDNRPKHETGIDLNAWLWRYKKWRWRNASFSIVCPSRWLADCARRSVLFRQRDITWIPNPVDLSLYRPIPKDEARAVFDLPRDRRLILFASLNATADPRKGYHHLTAAIGRLADLVDPNATDLVVLGDDARQTTTMGGFTVHSLGKIFDEERIARAYNAADLFVLPTEADNLPNSVKEATACGIPCVGFDVGGMPDMVAHKETGYLARPYDAEELAAGIAWVLERTGAELSAKVRARAAELHDPGRCVERYLDLYRRACGRQG